MTGAGCWAFVALCGGMRLSGGRAAGITGHVGETEGGGTLLGASPTAMLDREPLAQRDEETAVTDAPSNLTNLVPQLTLEEKASLVLGSDFWRTAAVERLGIPRIMVSDGPHGLRAQ